MEKKGIKQILWNIAGAIWFPFALCFFIIFSFFAAVGILGLGIPLWRCYSIRLKKHNAMYLLAISPRPKVIDIKPQS